MFQLQSESILRSLTKFLIFNMNILLPMFCGTWSQVLGQPEDSTTCAADVQA